MRWLVVDFVPVDKAVGYNTNWYLMRDPDHPDNRDEQRPAVYGSDLTEGNGWAWTKVKDDALVFKSEEDAVAAYLTLEDDPAEVEGKLGAFRIMLWEDA